MILDNITKAYPSMSFPLDCCERVLYLSDIAHFDNDLDSIHIRQVINDIIV